MQEIPKINKNSKVYFNCQKRISLHQKIRRATTETQAQITGSQQQSCCTYDPCAHLRDRLLKLVLWDKGVPGTNSMKNANTDGLHLNSRAQGIKSALNLDSTKKYFPKSALYNLMKIRQQRPFQNYSLGKCQFVEGEQKKCHKRVRTIRSRRVTVSDSKLVLTEDSNIQKETEEVRPWGSQLDIWQRENF